MSLSHHALLACTSALVLGCGGSTEPRLGGSPLDNPPSTLEICDGLDNDHNGLVDEPFRDAEGRYVSDEHCGVCDNACSGTVPHSLTERCGLVGGVPRCTATECEAGWEPLATGICVPWDAHLCLDCLEDEDCGGFERATCSLIAGESRCTVSCSGADCPAGYACRDGLCEPAGGSCSCGPGDAFEMACAIRIEGMAEPCVGHATCTDGTMSECTGSPEECDGRDNDCDGEADEDFLDELGVYSHINHCGACGIDCTADIVPYGDLTCGGDPYAPICHLLCEDTLDGLHIGDEMDADLVIANGCECVVTTLDDEAGPVGAYGQDLDTNCDGADGLVRSSFYVAPDGDDSNPGSPMRPLLSISAAVEQAAASLGTDSPKPDVFVVSGTYIEVLELPDGVRLHGGYRNDFLGLDPDGYITLLISSDPAGAPGGAALVMDGAGVRETVVEGLHVQGSDAPSPGQPAFGAYVRTPGSSLLMRNLSIRSGRAGSGASGAHGTAGDPPTVASGDGDPIRASVEDTYHECIRGSSNTVQGGRGGSNTCDGHDVSGGRGGNAVCPVFSSYEEGGIGGLGLTGTPGGAGGSGGVDSEGPIFTSCPSWICCGLSDFTVPWDWRIAGDGGVGSDGTQGEAGTGCWDPMGDLSSGVWTPVRATVGTKGGPGAGGGGGGAGGGVYIDWYAVECEFPDGLGGGGGGGGAGGCGGQGGQAGTSGAPSVGLVIEHTWSGTPPPVAPLPRFEELEVHAGEGGSGGTGGAGGGGGVGGAGSPGGDLDWVLRTSLTLSAPTRGGHGGPGGTGGPGGGGGGGCGGSSVAVWVILRGAGDPGYLPALAGSTLMPGITGMGGSGGGGAVPGGDGSDGEARNVVIE
jgi:hypothetical protein